MATTIEHSADLEIGTEANDGGGEGSGAEHASPAPAKAAPVRDVLSKTALALLAPKARSKPLSAQTDGFVLSTIGRLVIAVSTGNVSSAIAGADLRELLDEADRRAIAKQLSAGTCTEAERIASIDDSAAPIETEQSIDLHVETDSAEPSDLGEPFAGRVIEIAIANVIPDRDQPRLDVDDELADSIKAQGVLQPIVVRRNPTPNDAPFILVDGERRYRGALKAGLEVIPARVVHDVEDAGDRLLHQVVFNEGKRLAPMEEAKAWARIMGAKGWNIQQLASALGRAKSTVSDRLAMLNAPAAFQPLFEKGVLTPAAAPIVRGLADVPERFLTALVEELSNEQWAEFTATDTPVPLSDVKAALSGYALHAVGLRRLDHLGAAAKGYAGPTCTIEGKTFATDADQLEEVTTAYYRGGSSSSSRNADVDDYQKRQADENRKRRQKRERTIRLRRAQFDAILAKLPTSIDANAALFLIDALVSEMQLLSQAATAKALGIETPAKKQFGSPDWHRAILLYAKDLDVKGRVRTLLQLAMGVDLQVSEYEPDGPGKRLVAAAAAFHVDLKKVKAPDPAAAEKKPAAKKAAKKGGRR